MKKSVIFFFSLLFILSACKTEFETIRTSGDADRILSYADELYDQGDYTRAITLYELILPAYRGRAEGEEMFYKFAEAHFKNRSYILAAHYFKSFADTYGTSPKREDALYMTAYSNFKLSPRFKLDQTYSDKSIAAFQLFVNTYPDSEKVAEVNELIDELRKKKEIKQFEAGKLYYEMKKYSAAVVILENMLDDFPETNKDEQARYIIAKANHLLAKNSIYTKQEERFKDTVKSCDRFLKKYLDSKYTNEILNYKNESLEELNKIENG